MTPPHRDFMAWRLGKREARARHEVSTLLAERPPSHIKFPGSWEEAAVHINLDALYQRGIFEVAHAVAVAGPGWMMPNTAHRNQKIEYLAALRGGFAALDRVRTLLDDEGQSSALSTKDLRKNYALCASRLAFALATLDHTIVTSNIASHRDSEEDGGGGGGMLDKVDAAMAALRGIQAFQRDDPTDGAHAAFQQVVPLLKGISGLSEPSEPSGRAKREAAAVAAEAAATTKKKKRKKKEKKRKRTNTNKKNKKKNRKNKSSKKNLL